MCNNYLMITLKNKKMSWCLLVTSKTETGIFISKWKIDSFGAIFCWKQRLKRDENRKICFSKGTHWKNATSNKTPALTKIMNMDIWVVGTLNQLFIIGFLNWNKILKRKYLLTKLHSLWEVHFVIGPFSTQLVNWGVQNGLYFPLYRS